MATRPLLRGAFSALAQSVESGWMMTGALPRCMYGRADCGVSLLSMPPKQRSRELRGLRPVRRADVEQQIFYAEIRGGSVIALCGRRPSVAGINGEVTFPMDSAFRLFLELLSVAR